MKISKTKEELVNMYIDSLKEGKIPWRERWVSSLNVNGISDKEYKGINQLLLSYVTYKEQYNDNRWFTYYQINKKRTDKTQFNFYLNMGIGNMFSSNKVIFLLFSIFYSFYKLTKSFFFNVFST